MKTSGYKLQGISRSLIGAIAEQKKGRQGPKPKILLHDPVVDAVPAAFAELSNGAQDWFKKRDFVFTDTLAALAKDLDAMTEETQKVKRYIEARLKLQEHVKKMTLLALGRIKQ
jgi:hypothetical protein